MAERQGFEPWVRRSRTADFESAPFNHSGTSPGIRAGPGRSQWLAPGRAKPPIVAVFLAPCQGLAPRAGRKGRLGLDFAGRAPRGPGGRAALSGVGMKYITTLFLGLFLTFCGHQPSTLDEVRQGGALKVVTWNNPTTYYQGPWGPTGLEFDLAKRFARELGVKLQVVQAESPQRVIPDLLAGRGHLAAARLMVTPRRKGLVRFGPVYDRIQQHVVYRRGEPRPRSLEDLQGRHLEVVTPSPEARLLRELLPRYPGLSWQENESADQAELLALVWERVVDVTIANEDELALARRFHPELRSAFEVGEPTPVAWAFPPGSDDSLDRKSVV